MRKRRLDILQTVGRCSYVAFLRDKGATYTAIASKVGISKTRVKQLLDKHVRLSRANALHGVGKYVLPYNEQELNETVTLLIAVSKGKGDALQRHA